MKESSLRIEANHFTPGSETRIDGHDFPGTQWGCKQQLAEIFCKYPYGFFIGVVFCAEPEFVFNRRFQQTLIAIVN